MAEQGRDERPRGNNAGDSHRRELERAKAIVARWVIEPHVPGDGTEPGHIAIE